MATIPTHPSFQKLSVSIHRDNARKLSDLAKYLHVSRSSLVDQLLQGALTDMHAMLQHLPANPDDLSTDDVIRLRGNSVPVIQRRIQELQELMSDD